MNSLHWRAIRAIIRKDLTVALRSKFVVLPLILLPLIFVILLPLIVGGAFAFWGTMPSNNGDLEEIVSVIPPQMLQQFAGLSLEQMGIQFLLIYAFAPFYLILPLMTASVIAADSFAGEKERKTLEALLHTPTSDLDLLVAKLLGGWIPAVLVAWVSFVVYTIVLDSVTWRIFHGTILPNVVWFLLAFWVAPAVAGAGLGATVLVSARVSSFQEAYQGGSLLVLPIIALVIGQATGLIFLSPVFAFLLGVLFWLIDAILFWFGLKSFRRSELLARL
jgi:ABC-type Na+ efflux pump permease subunit